MPDTDFARAVQIRDAAAQIRAERHAGRRRGSGSACRSRWRPATMLSRSAIDLRVAAAAHHVLGAAELDQPAADVVVAAAHRLDDLADRDAVGAQAVRDRR